MASNRSGRAVTNARAPVTFAVCDRCGTWYNLPRLSGQNQWRGMKLADTGYLVCRTCLDVPNEQLRTIILPPDPVPVLNPRPSTLTTPARERQIDGSVSPALPTPGNLGFQQYVLGAAVPPIYPETKADVLTAVAAASGVATPASIIDRGTIITPANTSIQLMAANTARSWLVIYNPAVWQVQIALSGTAFWSVPSNIQIGPGQVWFAATAQGVGAPWTGPISIIGLYPQMSLFAWEDGIPALLGPLLLEGGGDLLLDGGGDLLLE